MLKTLRIMLYHFRCGIHSNIPLCCNIYFNLVNLLPEKYDIGYPFVKVCLKCNSIIECDIPSIPILIVYKIEYLLKKLMKKDKDHVLYRRCPFCILFRKKINKINKCNCRFDELKNRRKR